MFWANRGRELSLKRLQQQQQNSFTCHNSYIIILFVFLWSVVWFFGAFHFIYSISSSDDQSLSTASSSFPPDVMSHNGNGDSSGSFASSSSFGDQLKSKDLHPLKVEDNEDNQQDEQDNRRDSSKRGSNSDGRGVDRARKNEKEEEDREKHVSIDHEKYLRRNNKKESDGEQEDGGEDSRSGGNKNDNEEDEERNERENDDKSEGQDENESNRDGDDGNNPENVNSNDGDDGDSDDANDQIEQNGENESNENDENQQQEQDDDEGDGGESSQNNQENNQQEEDGDEFDQSKIELDQGNKNKYKLQEESGSLAEDLPQPPAFWKPVEGEDVDSIGFDINGQPSIFVGIASYRDMMCHETISRIFEQAQYPNRIFVGAVEQNAPGDESCIYTKVPCYKDPQQTICKYLNQIRLHRVHAKFALGPTFGRHRADALYRGETYALQIDAHMFFIKDWDLSAIRQWRATKNDYAVLSNYPSDSTDALDSYGRSKIHSTPGICRSDFVDAGMLKHGSAMEFYPPNFIKEDEPILVPFWGAGVSFSRGHRIVRVPYDCCLPMLFDGEETSMLLRMWTHGYDIYTFHSSIVFHPYFRKQKPPMFWENGRAHPHDVSKAQKRISRILGTSIGTTPSEKNPEPADVEVQYRLGRKRQASQFWRLFGVDFVNSKIRNNCQATTSGHIHRSLTPFLRLDGKGIDYSKIPMDKFGEENSFKLMATMAVNGEGIYKEVKERNELMLKAKKALRGG